MGEWKKWRWACLVLLGICLTVLGVGTFPFAFSGHAATDPQPMDVVSYIVSGRVYEGNAGQKPPNWDRGAATVSPAPTLSAGNTRTLQKQARLPIVMKQGVAHDLTPTRTPTRTPSETPISDSHNDSNNDCYRISHANAHADPHGHEAPDHRNAYVHPSPNPHADADRDRLTGNCHAHAQPHANRHADWNAQADLRRRFQRRRPGGVDVRWAVCQPCSFISRLPQSGRSSGRALPHYEACAQARRT